MHGITINFINVFIKKKDSYLRLNKLFVYHRSNVCLLQSNFYNDSIVHENFWKCPCSLLQSLRRKPPLHNFVQPNLVVNVV